MRRNRIHNQPNHNAGGMLSVRGMLALLVFVSGCQTRELVEPEEAGQIRFVPRVNGFAATESGGADTKSRGTVEIGGAPSTFYLHVTESDWPVTDTPDTKSQPVTEVHSTMKVSGYSYSGAWDGTQLPNLFEGVTLTKSGSTWTGLSPKMQWPGAAYKVRFGAMSPASGIAGLYWNSDGGTAGMPVIEYIIPTTVSEQVDILECMTDEYRGDGSDSRDGVEMDFRHALTAIKFRTEGFGIDASVKSISISGIYKRGTHVIGSDSWTPYGSISSSDIFTPTFTSSIDVNESESKDITSGANTLILLPQTCPASAKLTVTLTISGTDYKLEASLSGQIWVPNKEITYTLSSSNTDYKAPVLDISSVPESVTSGVSTIVATIKSYREHMLGFRKALPWSIQYSTDGGVSYSDAKPTWLTSISPTSGEGGWAGETITATATRASNEEHRVKIKVSNGLNINTFDIVLPETGPFGGLWITPAPLYYDGTKFIIKDNDWNHDSYGAIYGKNTGSYYFSFIELGQYFDSEGSSFNSTSGDIDNANTLSYAGTDGWRLPTVDDLTSIFSTTRKGSTVNGTISGCSFALVDISGITHAGKTTINGVVIFPDYVTMTGLSRVLTYIDSTTRNTGVTASQLQEYIDRGCIFIPASGHGYNTKWFDAGSVGLWWISSSLSDSDGDILQITGSGYNFHYYGSKDCYMPVRLVR